MPASQLGSAEWLLDLPLVLLEMPEVCLNSQDQGHHLADQTVRASTQQPRLYVGMVLILIFAEVLGLYGVIVSILMLTRSKLDVTECMY